MELQLGELRGTPVFRVHDRAPALTRVYGGVFDGDNNIWYFPAYPPFGQLVMNDLAKVAKGLTHGPGVKEHLEYLASVKERIARKDFPELKFITSPFEHQREGLSFLWHYPRSALFWDPGTGKSKTVIDLMRLCKGKRFLIITPKVTVLNWIEQIQIHAGDELKARALLHGQEMKRKSIRNFEKYDVLVMSYGTARTLGLPKVTRGAMRLIKEGMELNIFTESGAITLARIIRKLSDPGRQEDLVWARAFGATYKELEECVANEIKEDGPQWLEDLDFYGVVADESHCIKDTRSTQTKAVVALSKRAARRHLMSGTPTAGNPLHIYPQLRFLAPFTIPEDWLQFQDKFLIRAKFNKRMILGFQNMNIINERVQRVSITKKKEECLDLPPRIGPIDISVELSAEQKRMYNALVNDGALDLAAFFDNTPEHTLEMQNSAVTLNKLAQVTSGFIINSGTRAEICNGCQHLAACVEKNVVPYTPACHKEKKPKTEIKFTKENPKLEALEEWLDDILTEGVDAGGQKVAHKAIVWAVYHAELDLIAELLEKKKIGYVRVDGSTGTKIQGYVTKFNTDPTCRVYLGQVATGVGITLNAADYMAYYTLDWSLLTYIQSIDRNYRAGQTKKVAVYRFLGKGTVDEYKAVALDEKRDISAVLTSKLACITCSKRVECLKKNVELFDDGCIYKRSARRTVARPETI